MGFGGIGLAWREAARLIGAPSLIGEVFLAEMDIVAIEDIMNPPRFIAVARQR